jgi:hypothetical protein
VYNAGYVLSVAQALEKVDVYRVDYRLITV